jgi:hypothetical protein
VKRYLFGFAIALALAASPPSASAQPAEEDSLSSWQQAEPTPEQPPSEPAPEEPCPKGEREGAIAGIVVGSVFFTLLPMSIPVLITQSQKLKAHNKALSERRCQYALEEPTLQLQLDEAGVGVVPSGYTEEKPDAFSAELRFELAANAYRWSSYVPERSGLPDYGKRSFNFVLGLGVRFFPKGAHGVLLDFEYLFDPDFDSPPGPGWFCIFDCPPDLWLYTEFALVHAGYAYRHVVQGPRDPGRLAWAFTPHASLSMGQAYTEASSDTSLFDLVAGAYSPVVGARFGIDIDLHIKRFFMGWTLRYEILKHTKGPLRVSHLFSFNIVPVFAIGAVLGAKVQEQGR